MALRALFVGLGSIGARHLKNLNDLCLQRGIPLEVWALRSSGAPLAAETAALVNCQPVAPTPWEFSTALGPDVTFDLAFVTNPTHLHAATVAALWQRVGCFFIEKPIFDNPEEDLAALGLEENRKAYIAAPLRHTQLYTTLKEQLSNRQIFSARAICSSYLPEWRPGDYRQRYSSHRDQGGGVSLDLIHEWDYLSDLLGTPTRCHNLRGAYSTLELDGADDLSVYIAEFNHCLCELHLDYFGRQYRRQAEFLCEEGSVTADFGTGLLTLPNGSHIDCSEPEGELYRREMAWFLNYALEDAVPNMNSPQRALETLRITFGDEKDQNNNNIIGR